MPGLLAMTVPGLMERSAPPCAADEQLALLGRVVDIIHERCGISFGGYRAATIERRIRNRMIMLGEMNLRRYVARLKEDSREAAQLLERLTLKVSRFFRNAGTFNLLRQELRRRAERAAGGRLSVWSAGCARGEEAYSLAILLEGIGAKGSSVLGTDVDPSALAFAARGRYRLPALCEAPTDTVARYFEHGSDAQGDWYEVTRPVRERVAFAVHDLTRHETTPGQRRFDLVACRNVLIYFRAPVQDRVQRLLRDRLAPGAFLCLGEAEWVLPSVAKDFDVVDRKTRLFARR